ncbi:unnamed protein product [Phytophthora fragariaefolia]|uniref:Unnamed protein product n=1 Tax=Phytophthora fragariaefolia TaxID=1490495 RepID=A0A9W6TL19_9STRA|nr:unnamed protein product [Phytophthora fragariaefolia]
MECLSNKDTEYSRYSSDLYLVLNLILIDLCTLRMLEIPMASQTTLDWVRFSAVATTSTPLHGVILKVNTQNQNVNAQIQNSSEMLYLFQYAFIRLILVGANSMAGTL